jgi:NADP-dependent 3-hydroxy acid dehydrogenase YdfG
MDLLDKVVVITGASSGLGKALALRFCTEKPKIVLLSRSADKLQDVVQTLQASGCEVSCFACNITDWEQIHHTVEYIIEAYGRIDVLVNNAGILYEEALEDYSVNTILELFDVNSIGAICMTQAVLPHMKKARSGQIFNVISTAGRYPKSKSSVYNSTKFALDGFNQSLKTELEGTGIRVIGFYPGGMEPNLFTTTPLGPVKDEMTTERDQIADIIVYTLKQPENLCIDHIEVRRFTEQK